MLYVLSGQVSRDVLNNFIVRLNAFLELEEYPRLEGDSTEAPRLRSFTMDELSDAVNGQSDGKEDAPMFDSALIKIVLLALVHLRRLDFGTENRIKVYKLRRFY